MDREETQANLLPLMTFLAVARLGRFVAAAEVLGINHATVSRRIATLEKSLGGRLLVRTASGWEVTEFGQSAVKVAEDVERALRQLTPDDEPDRVRGTVRISAPDAFVSDVCTPALAQLQQSHPGLSVEVLSVTQRARQNRSGLDLEVVVGKPQVLRAQAHHLMDYSLQLYATADYLDRHGVPERIQDLNSHRLNYYVEAALTIDDLDRATQRLPSMRRGIASTNVYAHVMATLAGAGIGLLPKFLAESNEKLLGVLHEEFAHNLSYWAVAREESLRNPAVQAVYFALKEYGRECQDTAAVQLPAA